MGKYAYLVVMGSEGGAKFANWLFTGYTVHSERFLVHGAHGGHLLPPLRGGNISGSEFSPLICLLSFPLALGARFVLLSSIYCKNREQKESYLPLIL